MPLEPNKRWEDDEDPQSLFVIDDKLLLCPSISEVGLQI